MYQQIGKEFPDTTVAEQADRGLTRSRRSPNRGSGKGFGDGVCQANRRSILID